MESQLAEVHKRRQDTVQRRVEQVVKLPFHLHGQLGDGDTQRLHFKSTVVAVEIAAMVYACRGHVDDGVVICRVDLLDQLDGDVFFVFTNGSQNLRIQAYEEIG